MAPKSQPTFNWDLFPFLKKFTRQWIWGISFIIFVSFFFLLLVLLSCSVIHGIEIVGRDVTIGKVNATLTMGAFAYCIKLSDKKTCSKARFLYPIDNTHVQAQFKDATTYINAFSLLYFMGTISAALALVLALFPRSRREAGLFACLAAAFITLELFMFIPFQRSVPQGIPHHIHIINYFTLIPVIALLVFAYIKLRWEKNMEKNMKMEMEMENIMATKRKEGLKKALIPYDHNDSLPPLPPLKAKWKGEKASLADSGWKAERPLAPFDYGLVTPLKKTKPKGEEALVPFDLTPLKQTKRKGEEAFIRYDKHEQQDGPNLGTGYTSYDDFMRARGAGNGPLPSPPLSPITTKPVYSDEQYAPEDIQAYMALAHDTLDYQNMSLRDFVAKRDRERRKNIF